MACGECGDPRNLCRCQIAAADSSVIITGSGDSADPFLISAPGAGAGTRDHDRASIYDTELDGTYPLPLPPDYPHYAFYGPADPVDIPGYTPAQFDSWHRITPGAPIALRSSGRAESDSGSTLTVTLPSDVRDGDVVVLTVGATGGPAPVPPSGWAQIITTSSVFTGAWFRVCMAITDADTTHVFTGLTAPFGGYWQVYSGVDPDVLDTAGVAVSSGETAVASLTVPALTASTDGVLLLSAATIDSPATTLVAPTGMSTINVSAGTAPRHAVASQTGVRGPNPDRTWTHLPAAPLRQYSGIQVALRPAHVTTYYLWVDGTWTAVGNDGSGGYTTTIGDGVRSTFTVVHPLDSTDLLIECVNTETGQTCWPVIQRTSPDTVYLDFGNTVPAVAARRVLISKGGQQGPPGLDGPEGSVTPEMMVLADAAAASATASQTSATASQSSATASQTSATNAANSAAAVPKWWTGTQTAYTAIATKDPNTLYLITGP